MISRWRWLLRQFTRKLWLSAALYSAVAVVTALAASLFEPFIPARLADLLAADAVDRVLGILASSMLAVTTFSLATVVSAYGAVTSNATPRASVLITDDRITKNTLGAFIGSFLFSLVGIMGLNAGAYGERGHVVLFIVTIAMVALIIGTLLRWIDHLTRLGRVGETTDRVEAAALQALVERAEYPCLGARPLRGEDAEIPAHARAVHAEAIGYVQHVDIAALVACAQRSEGRIWVLAPPGGFADPTRPLARIAGIGEEADIEALRRAFTIGNERTFSHDPRFGLSVLAEIASRALSPAVNDPGTAIDVIGRAIRVLTRWAEHPEKEPPLDQPLPDVWFPPLDVEDIFDDVFTPIARDGAGLIEIQIRMRKALLALAEIANGRMRAPAERHAALALERADAALPMAFERERLRAIDAPRRGPVAVEA